jgi:hypothetical protein
MFSRLKTFSIAFGLVIILIGIITTSAHAAVGITIATDPLGRSYQVDGNVYATNMIFFWDPGSVHYIAVLSPQIVGSDRYVFTGWSDGGAIGHEITVGDISTAYTASFQPLYLLATSVSPVASGTVTIDPVSADGYYARFSSVTLTAVPNPGFSFSYWNGDPTDTANPRSTGVISSRTYTAYFAPASHSLPISAGGSARYDTLGTTSSIPKSGYAKLILKSGTTPYGTAVFIYKQNGITVSEAGVPASPPTTHARVFIDSRSSALAVPGRSNSGKININTGIGVVNCGSAAATITYTLIDPDGSFIATGQGTLGVGNHFAKFIDQLSDVASGFVLPANLQFASLDIFSDQPLSVMALRMTLNQRAEPLFTTTPVADLSQAYLSDPLYFPQIADGGGYTTSLVLLNTSSSTERGTILIYDDSGRPFIVEQAGGLAASSFQYSIPAGGTYRFQTNGFSAIAKAGWVQVIPSYMSASPVGSAIFSYNPAAMLLTESGVPSALPTTHARIYVDLTQNHNTGLAITNLGSDLSNYAIQAFQTDGITLAGSSQGINLPSYGHAGQFASQIISGLPSDFTGVLDVSSASPFVALTLRSLSNERGDFLITTFPIADVTQPAPSPVVFPHIADGGGYKTQFILLSPGGEADTSLILYDDAGVSFETN